nr:synaptotagmin-like protein 1 [Paramormyrops kingsleyae]XP_023687786.1 synaptotagmin-like protein 1 [Paramormyrops kingsleyae]
MECDGGSETPLDLSHLTEEEQAAILHVLVRDSELRNAEERRVRKLQNTVLDPQRLKTLTGGWFKELWSKRHKRLGSDIVQASIRRKKKPNDVSLSVLPLFEKPPSPKPLRLNGEEEAAKWRSAADRVSPTPAPRRMGASKSPEMLNGSPGSTECVREQRQKEETAEEESALQNPSFHLQVDSEKDSDSLSSTATDLDPTRIRPSDSVSSLHSNHTLSGSMMSLFSSGEFGAVEVRGTLQFTLYYDTKKEEFHVQVCRCQDLALARKNRSDPYVKTYLLPDKTTHSKRKTNVKKKTVNPVFEETLKYKIKMMELKGRTLNLSVWHHDPLRRNIFLGEVEVALAEWDWGQKDPVWHPLVPRVQLSQGSVPSRGTLMLSMKFVPAESEGHGMPVTGELHIWIREAQGLIPIKGGAVDSFIKSYILPDESRSSRQKTRVVKRTVSPTFNHTMVYDGFHVSDLNEACAEITLWEKDSLSSRQLGGMRLSTGSGQSYGQPVVWMDSTEEEINVWTTMIQHPNAWVDASLPLRTDLTTRKE